MEYQDYIKIYRKLLLEIIRDFFNEEEILNFNFNSPNERVKYFTDPKFSIDPEFYTKEYIHHYLSDKEKHELREPYIKQQKKWIKKCSAFVRKLKDVLSYIDHPDIPQFRFKFFNKNDKYLEDALKDTTGLSIFICFISYLYYLKERGKSVKEAIVIVNDKMIAQEDEYTQKNRDRIKKVLGRKVKKKRGHRIPDKDFKHLCKEVERGCQIAIAGKEVFFKELSKASKDTKYHITGKGYTPLTARKRFYEVFSSKKSNQ